MGTFPAEHVLFDLDGTLVDSSADIRATLAWAFAEAGFPGTPLDAYRVGPTLEELVRLCAPPGLGEAGAAEVVAHFARRYDGLDFLGTPLYPGVAALLERLAGAGIGCSLATLKRAAPTGRLLAAKGLLGRFRAVACVDSLPGRRETKQAMVARLVRELGLDPRRTLLVGDTPEDLRAAHAAGLAAVWARYGYGDPALALAERPEAVLEQAEALWPLLASLPGT
jgi:phosphoglycolate phosphatase